MKTPDWAQNIRERAGKAVPLTLVTLGSILLILVISVFVEIYGVLAGEARPDFWQNLLEYLAIAGVSIFAVGPLILLFFVLLNGLSDLMDLWFPVKNSVNINAIEVKFNEHSISSNSPEGETLKVAWSDIDQVLIKTTEGTKAYFDAFLEIQPSNPDEDIIVIPREAPGTEELLSAMQDRLPGFDNEKVAVALSATSPDIFMIWDAENSQD